MKKRVLNIILAITTMFVIIGMNSLSANAQGKFDPTFYAATYSDVASAVGTDPTALYNHYVKYGIKEGRLPYSGATEGEVVEGMTTDEESDDFDAVYYAQNNPDVVKVVGTDPAALYQHYVKYGKAEGRKASAASTDTTKSSDQTTDSSTDFDANYYAKTYPDVAKSVGTDATALYNHYIKYGKKEGRFPNATAAEKAKATTSQKSSSTKVSSSSSNETKNTYVLNTNTKKFHYPGCKSVKQMSDKNKASYTGTRSEVIGMGYSPCGNCNP